MFLHLSVSHSVHRLPLVRGGRWSGGGGVCDCLWYWANTPPLGRHTLLPSACWDTMPYPVHAGIHTPTQCMLVYGQQANSIHPTELHSCLAKMFAENCMKIKDLRGGIKCGIKCGVL